MLRQELTEKLKVMKDITVVSEEDRRTLKMKDGPWYKDNYSVDRDFRIRKLFNYITPRQEDFKKYMQDLSFVIAAVIGEFEMVEPSEEQMLDLMEISGYTGAEMREFIWDPSTPNITCILQKQLAAVIYLLARVLNDALVNKTEWEGYKKGRQKSGFQKQVNPDREKLNRFTAYMREHGILPSEYDEEEHKYGTLCYENFVKNHAIYICMFMATTYEVDELNGALKDSYSKAMMNWLREYDSAQAKKQAQKGKNTVSPAMNKLPELPSFADLHKSPWTTLTNAPGDLSAMGASARDPEVRAITKKMHELEAEFDKIRDRSDAYSDRIIKETNRLRSFLVQQSDPYGIAIGLFQAILDDRDDIYKLTIGQDIMYYFQAQCSMPASGVKLDPLDDEEKWDYLNVDLNGSLGLPVIRENETFTLSHELSTEGFEDLDEEDMVPLLKDSQRLTAIISRYANRSFEGPVYIRKSIVKFFRGCGFSERRARDFAVIIATLTNVNFQESKSYFSFANYPVPDADRSSSRESEAVVDERVAAAENARIRAERDLKQAQKENKLQRHEISTLQRENEALRQQLAELQKKPAAPPEDEVDRPVSEEDETVFPFEIDLKVVVYGGFEVFHQELLKLMPGVRIVEYSAHIDLSPIRNADIVFLQYNKTSHSGYWTVRDACKAAGVRFFHLNYASARRCAEVMAEQIRKMERGEFEPQPDADA